MKILLTTTSFQDTPGKHHDLLNSQNWDIDYLRGPVDESILLPIIHKYDGVICGDDHYTREVIKAGSKGNLKVLSKYGVGLDRIDLDAAKDFGVIVTNVPGVNQVSVAEHVLALLFSFQKNIHLQFNTVQNKSWKRLIGNEIEGSTIGIIGLGSVGKELAKKSLALGMSVYCFDLYKDEDFLSQFNDIVFTDNINDIYENNDYPLDYRGVPVSGALRYPDLSEKYYGGQIRFTNVTVQDMKMIGMDIFGGIVRYTTEGVKLNI